MTHSYIPQPVRARRRELERQATALLRRADRRRRQARKPVRGTTSPQELPRKLTLADLPELRRRGFVP
jgi:hypothetical protein